MLTLACSTPLRILNCTGKHLDEVHQASLSSCSINSKINRGLLETPYINSQGSKISSLAFKGLHFRPGMSATPE